MYNVVVLWAPDSADNRRIVEMVARALEQTKVALRLKSASEATIADLTAADILVFGAQKVPAGEAPSEYSDLLRIFRASCSPVERRVSFLWGRTKQPFASARP